MFGESADVMSRDVGRVVCLAFAVALIALAASSGTAEESQCSSVTHLVGGANVPRDWETLTVTVNDVEIQQIERSGTMRELRSLPDQVRP